MMMEMMIINIIIINCNIKNTQKQNKKQTYLNTDNLGNNFFLYSTPIMSLLTNQPPSQDDTSQDTLIGVLLSLGIIE